MYRVSTAFAGQLTQKFQGRLRLRWSQARHEYQLEQKVRRGLALGPVRDSHDDEGIRRRDGYHYVLSIQPGTRMACPRCASELAVPVCEFREVTCAWCKLQGYEHRVSAGYFPLNDTLLEYLQRLDPEHEASRATRAHVDRHNLAHQAQLHQSVLNATTDKANDDFRRIAGIPMTGYTGTEFRG